MAIMNTMNTMCPMINSWGVTLRNSRRSFFPMKRSYTLRSWDNLPANHSPPP